MYKHNIKLLPEEASLSLEWYYNYSDADTGDKSNYSSMIAVKCGNNINQGYQEKILNAVHRKAQIRKALQRLSYHDQKLIIAYFCPHTIRLSNDLRFAFNSYAILIYLLNNDDQIKLILKSEASINNAQVEVKLELNKAIINFCKELTI